jgi:hypothetical protein
MGIGAWKEPLGRCEGWPGGSECPGASPRRSLRLPQDSSGHRRRRLPVAGGLHRATSSYLATATLACRYGKRSSLGRRGVERCFSDVSGGNSGGRRRRSRTRSTRCRGNIPAVQMVWLCLCRLRLGTVSGYPNRCATTSRIAGLESRPPTLLTQGCVAVGIDAWKGSLGAIGGGWGAGVFRVPRRLPPPWTPSCAKGWTPLAFPRKKPEDKGPGNGG